jgi:hypothetical protein
MTPIEQLRELMARATPGPWAMSLCSDHLHVRDVSGLSCEKIRGANHEVIKTTPSIDAALIVLVHASLPALLAVVEAAQSTAYNSEHLGDGTTRCPSEVIDRLRDALAPLTTEKKA